MDNEKRVVNPTTGGEKGSKDAQLGWAPPEAMLELARVYGHGAEKYAPHNYRKGYAWSLSYNALLRHLFAFLGGEDYDRESGLQHMAHAAWHCLTLTQFLRDTADGILPADLDDRFEAPAAWPQSAQMADPYVGVECGVDLHPPYVYENCQQFDCGCGWGKDACVKNCWVCQQGAHMLKDDPA